MEQILTLAGSNEQVKTEVHYLINKTGDLKKLCRKCKEEQIISVIILHVTRTHNQHFNEEKMKIWNKYDLTWKLYSRIVSNLFKEFRLNNPI